MKQKFELWERVIRKLELDTTSDLHLINRDEIRNLYEGRQPSGFDRIDTYDDLPPILRSYGYFLLHLSPRWLALVRGTGFHWVEQQSRVEPFESRLPFTLSTLARNVSRFQALDNALNCGLLEHILNCGPLYRSATGRFATGFFDFQVRHLKLAASGVRMDLDMVLESHDTIVLVKTAAEGQTDFNLQQVFYPYRYLSRQARPKRVVLLFFSYEPSEERYDFWLYRFSDTRNLNSIEPIGKRSYVILGLRGLLGSSNIYQSPLLNPASATLTGIPQKRLVGVR